MNCRYQITANIDVDDGLTNGAGCIVKKFQFLTSSRVPSIVWVQFDEPKIGHQTRIKYREYFTQDIPSTLTPIFAIQRSFQTGKRQALVTRKQFPLAPAAAKTIHKTQGDTVNEIVVDLGTRTMTHSHYVAFSRVRNMSGLHILRFNETKISVLDKVKQEMLPTNR